MTNEETLYIHSQCLKRSYRNFGKRLTIIDCFFHFVVDGYQSFLLNDAKAVFRQPKLIMFNVIRLAEINVGTARSRATLINCLLWGGHRFVFFQKATGWCI